jgi:hypothetical protein
MTQNRAPSRELIDRLARAAPAYREAFERVETAIAHEANPNLPTWIFNLDGFNLEALYQISPTIAYAERHRRAARVALHAVAELMAFDDPAATLATQSGDEAPPGNAADMSAWMASLTSRAGDDHYWLRTLDRFVGIVNYADSGGCVYINGGFEPTVMHEDPDLEATEVKDVPRG